MTKVLITIDTELSAGLFQRAVNLEDNLASSIEGRCDAGSFGIGWQMDAMEAHGIKGCFFVDPMPALIYGSDFLRRIVQPVMERGHEVQLHLHPEWLDWVDLSPVGDARGRSIGDFSADNQLRLIDYAASQLRHAGASEANAFRAGNYGADDDTLTALRHLGYAWDTSFNPAYAPDPSAISLPRSQARPVEHCGIVELPVSMIFEGGGSLRPAQVCALSAAEMASALEHAAGQRSPAFVIVTHSFEMLSRNRKRPNRLLMKRFESLCETISGNDALISATFGDLEKDELLADPGQSSRLAAAPLRRWSRIAEQLLSNWIYDRQFRPL